MTGVTFFDIDSFQLEEGVVATEYERPAPAPDYPIEIHSLNDFDIVSGKGKENLLNGLGNNVYLDSSFYGTDQNNTDKINIDGKVWLRKLNTSNLRFKSVPTEIGKTYTYSMDVMSEKTGSITLSHWSSGGYGSQSYTVGKEIQRINKSFIAQGSNDILHTNIPTGVMIANIKFEEGSVGTPYVQTFAEIDDGVNDNHPLIDKINLLLDEPLRSIGDVKDRLFRDSDGLWKIERNVAQYISDGNESWRLQSAAQNRWDMTSNNLPINSIYDSNNNATTPVLNSHFIETRGSAVEGGTYVFVRNVRIYWAKPTSVDDLKSMLKSYHDNGNPVTWHYQIRPTIETLDQELQDKLNNLRSFRDSNYVYTVINDKPDTISERLKPTLHAIFKGGGWYSRWKTEDELEKHQANIDEKANQSDTEVRLNEIASELLVKQQEIEAAATAGELDAFVKKYNQEQEAFAKEKQASEDALASAQDAIDLITNKMDNMAETWEFFDEYIKFEEGSIVLGNETEGSHVRIHNDRISFYNSGYEVASITQGKMTIEAGTFVEEIQISEFKFQKSSNGHLTVRHVG